MAHFEKLSFCSGGNLQGINLNASFRFQISLSPLQANLFPPCLLDELLICVDKSINLTSKMIIYILEAQNVLLILLNTFQVIQASTYSIYSDHLYSLYTAFLLDKKHFSEVFVLLMLLKKVSLSMFVSQQTTERINQQLVSVFFH